MNSMTVPSRLQDVYYRLGPVHFLHFEDLDLVSAHYQLGEDVRSQVQMILTRRLDLLKTGTFAAQLRHVQACGEAIRLKGLAKGVPEIVRAAVMDYQRCLAAWAEGAGLHQFTHPFFEEVGSIPA